MIAERLREIRILKHYTVEDVAASIGVTKQAVSKYETGRAFPSADILGKIIDFYELPAGYLQKYMKEDVECSQLFYRRNQRTSKRELEEAQIRLKWYYEILSACNEVVLIPPADLPFFEEEWSIKEKADALRMHWGLQHNPIGNIGEILVIHGIQIFTAELTNTEIDGYSQVVGEYPIIILNQSKGSRERKNFSLAHELGHLVLHCGRQTIDAAQCETEADCFAAEFLMPEEELRKDIIQVNVESLKRLGEKWHVSPQSVLERCIRMGYLEQTTEVQQAHKQYLLRKLNSSKNYYVPEEETVCSIREVLKAIDEDEEKRDKFLKSVCFPITMMRQFFQIPKLFEVWENRSDSADELEGVQLAFQL